MDEEKEESRVEDREEGGEEAREEAREEVGVRIERSVRMRRGRRTGESAEGVN